MPGGRTPVPGFLTTRLQKRRARTTTALPQPATARSRSHCATCHCGVAASYPSRPAAGRLASPSAYGAPSRPRSARTTAGLLGRHPGVRRREQPGHPQVGRLGPRFLQRPHRGTVASEPAEDGERGLDALPAHPVQGADEHDLEAAERRVGQRSGWRSPTRSSRPATRSRIWSWIW
jgi:hypothetical protein